MAYGWKKEEVKQGLKRKDDDVLFEERRKSTDTPWIVITHAGQEILIDILRQTILQEVAKVIKEAFGMITPYKAEIIPKPDYQGITREDIQEILLRNQDYTSNRLKWSLLLDIELVLAALENYEARGSGIAFYKRFGDSYGFTHRAVEHRWLRLRKLLEGEIL